MNWFDPEQLREHLPAVIGLWVLVLSLIEVVLKKLFNVLSLAAKIGSILPLKKRYL